MSEPSHSKGALAKSKKNSTPPKWIARATEKRLIAKMNLRTATPAMASEVPTSNSNASNEKHKSFAPPNHLFKAPCRIDEIPMFGRIAIPQGWEMEVPNVPNSPQPSTSNADDSSLQNQSSSFARILLKLAMEKPWPTQGFSNAAPPQKVDKRYSEESAATESTTNSSIEGSFKLRLSPEYQNTDEQSNKEESSGSNPENPGGNVVEGDEALQNSIDLGRALPLVETRRETLLHDHATIGAQDLQGWQEVHQACRNNLVQHLDHLLFYGADMNARNASGNTPLHVCAVNNTDSSCIRQLLYRGAQKDSLNYANQTPYQVAVIAGNMELAEVIKSYQPEEVDRIAKNIDFPLSAHRLQCPCGYFYAINRGDAKCKHSPSVTDNEINIQKFKYNGVSFFRRRRTRRYFYGINRGDAKCKHYPSVTDNIQKFKYNGGSFFRRGTSSFDGLKKSLDYHAITIQEYASELESIKSR